MPKRKSEDDYEKLLKKFKKLEKKVRRRCRKRSSSSDRSRSKSPQYRSQTPEHEPDQLIELSDTVDPDITELLGENFTTQPEDIISTAFPYSDTNAVSSTPNPDSNSNMPASLLSDGVEPESADLGSSILAILGEDPTATTAFGPDIHKDLAVRLEHITINGLTKELRKEIFDKYLLPSNCKMINGPTLNVEIKATLNEAAIKRDKSIEIRQKQNAAAISCVSQVLNKLFSSKDADTDMIRSLMDVERILCDIQSTDSALRRNFIFSSPTIKKEMKDQLRNTKPDLYLFGENLNETLKAAKAITKSTADLKVPAPRPQAGFKNLPSTSNTKSLNWKGPYPPRKRPNFPRPREPPQSKPQRGSSLKQSQPPRPRPRR